MSGFFILIAAGLAHEPPPRATAGATSSSDSRLQVARALLHTLPLFLYFLHARLTTLCAVELRNGEMYRGRLVEAEDNMSCQLSGIVLTGKDGKVASLEQV